MLPPIPPLEVILAMLVVIFFAIGLHEYAHCKFADMAGDPTPRMYGRVTLNLTKHFEPLGTIMMILTQLTGVGIGWGRPAPVNPSKMRNPKWDHFAAVAAGPISNLVQAVVYAMVLRLLMRGGFMDWNNIQSVLEARGGQGMFGRPTFLSALLTYGVLTNLSLFLFNLFPLGPLDGHWLVGILLPPRAQAAWYIWQRRYGGQALLAIVILGQVTGFSLIWTVVGPPLAKLFSLLVGHS
jgi:Zn-dependent protease